MIFLIWDMLDQILQVQLFDRYILFISHFLFDLSLSKFLIELSDLFRLHILLLLFFSQYSPIQLSISSHILLSALNISNRERREGLVFILLIVFKVLQCLFKHFICNLFLYFHHPPILFSHLQLLPFICLFLFTFFLFLNLLLLRLFLKGILNIFFWFFFFFILCRFFIIILQQLSKEIILQFFINIFLSIIVHGIFDFFDVPFNLRRIQIIIHEISHFSRDKFIGIKRCSFGIFINYVFFIAFFLIDSISIFIKLCEADSFNFILFIIFRQNTIQKLSLFFRKTILFAFKLNFLNSRELILILEVQFLIHHFLFLLLFNILLFINPLIFLPFLFFILSELFLFLHFHLLLIILFQVIVYSQVKSPSYLLQNIRWNF